MTYKERVQREEGNHDRLLVFSDGGLFLTLYERSAYAFCTRVKSFKVNVRTVDGLDAPFVYIGVPASKAEDYLPGLEADQGDGCCFQAPLAEPIDEDGFQEWKAEAVSNNTKMKRQRIPKVGAKAADGWDAVDLAPDQEGMVIRHCVTEIKGLNMAAMTPMEAMNLLHSMQTRLKDIKV